MRATRWLGRLRRYLIVLVVSCLILVGYRALNHKMLVEKLATHAPSRRIHPSTIRPTHPPPPKVWFVIFTNSSDPNSQCIELAGSLPGWIILMVGQKPSSPHSHSRCRFLNHTDVEIIIESNSLGKLPLTNVSLLAAYIYAMQGEAEWIFLAPQVYNLDAKSIPSFQLTDPLHHSLVFDSSSTHLFQANLHFGCNASVANHDDYSGHYKICTYSTPPIQTTASLGPLQFVNAKGIDVSLQQETITYCDRTAPSVAISPNIFSLYNPHEAIYHRDAFWALPIFSRDFSESNTTIWSLIVQKLLWMIGEKLLLVNDGDNNATTQSTLNLASTASHSLWNRPCTSPDFSHCLMMFVDENLKSKQWSQSYSQWIEVLISIGYKFPSVLQNLPRQNCQPFVQYHPVKYSGTLKTKEWRRKPYYPVPNAAEISSLLEKTCRGSKLKDVGVDISHPWTQYSNILLVITFNQQHYETIPYLEALYRSFFPNILYCGPLVPPNVEKWPALAQLQFSFVTYTTYPSEQAEGAFNYECVKLAHYMGYNVEGYLVIADDLIVTTHPLETLLQKAPQNVWHMPQNEIRTGEILKLRECRLGMCDFYPRGWPWWEEYRPNVIELFYEVHTLQWRNPLIHRCYRELVRLNGADMRPNGGFADIYYIPQRLIPQFSELSNLFLKHQVFLEIAVPTMLRCLELPDDIQSLTGQQLVMHDRNQPWKYFTHKQMAFKNYIHPTKWANLTLGNRPITEFYCNKVLPFMHDRFARFPL